VRHETTVTALLRAEGGRVGGVRVQGRSGAAAELPAALTVGADGVRSFVAGQVRAPVVRKGQAASAVLYRYVAGLPADGYEWAYGAAAAAGLIPTNGGQTCMFVATTPQRMRALRRSGIEDTFASLLDQAAPAFASRVAAATPTGRIRGWGGVPGFMRGSWGPGWALVGDAGYFKDPITTHGITDGLRDAELLADSILESMTGATPEAVALAKYQRTRDRLSTRLFDATEAVASYSWDTGGVQALLRQVSSAMSDEVDHLQARPDRRITDGSVVLLPSEATRA
jgi:flavin-dependent dehydrogenase